MRHDRLYFGALFPQKGMTMQTLEYKTVDKSTWGEGEWQNEPDKKQWRDEATGLPCLIVRGWATGTLCGYVGIPTTHPLYEVSYSDEHPSLKTLFEKMKEGQIGKRGVIPLICSPGASPDVVFNVHGSLTYSGHCEPGEDDSTGICHIAEDEDKVWWFGFDCAHCMDRAPAMDAKLKEYLPDRDLSYRERNEYRNLEYVTQEVQLLAAQLAVMVHV